MSSKGVTNVFDDMDDDEAADLLGSFETEPAPATIANNPDARTPELSGRDKAAIKAADTVGQKMGYAERKAPKKKSVMRRSDSFRTGRNVPTSMKTTAEVRKRVLDRTNAQDWVAGQLLEYALDALDEKIANPDDPFWDTHLFHGVD